MSAYEHVIGEPKAARQRANDDVSANAKTYVAQALSNWSTIVTADAKSPDVHWSGKDAKIVAVFENDLHDEDLGSDKAWTVIAKTPRGNYFTLYCLLRDSADADPDNVGWKRLSLVDFSPLSALEVKRMLYKGNLMSEYQAEFGKNAPPPYIEG